MSVSYLSRAPFSVSLPTLPSQTVPVLPYTTAIKPDQSAQRYAHPPTGAFLAPNQTAQYPGSNQLTSAPPNTAFTRFNPPTEVDPPNAYSPKAYQPKTSQKNQQDNTFLGGRTKGMWLFDSLLYPVFTNAAVFVISVLATYSTTYGKENNLMRQRGDWARKQLQRLFKMSPQTAKETIMITFSFLDGCVMAPVVKLFEDHRMPIVKVFDQWMGTTPQDPSVYDKEPKQTWLSVLGGRTTAFALVLPTAKLLSKKIRDKQYSLNELLFAHPGKKVGEWAMKSWPGLQRRFPKTNLPGLAEVMFLEAFYTSLCTAGLYLSSRFLAKLSNKLHSSV